MLDQGTIADITAAMDDRRSERRRFLKAAGMAGAAVGGASLLAACGGSADDTTFGDDPVVTTPTPPTTTTDQDVLNFALNLEYLEAQFYSLAAFGQPLSSAQTSGQGAVGAVTGGRQVAFTDPVVAAYAREIARDEINHVNFLRGALAGSAVSMPAINIDGGANGAFTAAARAAGVISATQTFDPYATDENFLLAAFIFEDVGVTAYKGASPLITNKTFLEAAAGLLAVEAYHAGLVRTVLYGKGIQTPSAMLIENAQKISDARDSLDGTSDLDQGIGTATTANLVPADSTNALAFSRTTSQVLHIVYLNGSASASGGFFPNGVNGTIRASMANN